MRPKPYIGITGFMHRREVDEVLGCFPADSPNLVMIGMLASSRTIRGEPNKWPQRYPPLGQLGSIFKNDIRALNLIHFNTKDAGQLAGDMLIAHGMAGPYCDGFQLNIAWPDPRVLESYRTKMAALQKRHVIVLQCGGNALDQVNRDPDELAKRVAGYEGLIDYMLLDPSGGLGKAIDLGFATPCLDALEEFVPESIGLGIAGGLSAGNLWHLRPLLQKRRFSIDAEGRLRDANDDLDLVKACDYLTTADRYLQDPFQA